MKFYDDPIIAAALAEPDTDYLGDCRERHRRAYPGEYIATEGLALLDHDRDYLALVRRLRAVGTDGALITPPYYPSAPYDEHDELVVVDEGAMNAWLDSASRDFDVDTESAA